MKGILMSFMVMANLLYGQSLDFKVSVSNDTLLLGNYLEVKFEIKNGSGKFIAPDFNNWNIVAGPNSASSYSIINGETNRSSSYTYYLEAAHEGEFIIEAATFKTTEKKYNTPNVKIMVLKNPEGIRQHPKYKSVGKDDSPGIELQREPKKKRNATKL